MRIIRTDRRAAFCGLILCGVAVLAALGEPASAQDTGPERSRSITAPDGWSTAAARDEIRPAFAHEREGGSDGRGCLVIRADRREGLDGCWRKEFAVAGGKSYRFRAEYQAEGVAVPRRSVVASIIWTDGRG